MARTDQPPLVGRDRRINCCVFRHRMATYRCLLGAVMTVYGYPVGTLSCALYCYLFFSLSACRWMLSRHQWQKAPLWLKFSRSTLRTPALSLARLKR
ncbi:hypothetical protein KCP70_00130 [Salmonella enterica subsp. enterica]|nr:hypothetical protein KCP70_00130 [Salmonella enterica subsp. enterica]